MIGIVILNYNNWNDTVNCIESINRIKVQANYKIYLVDNASRIKITEEDKYILKNSNVCFLQAKTNKGYAAGNNIGILKALEEECDAILIANNDIIFHENSIDELYWFLINNLEYGIVGPKILRLDGSIQMTNMCVKTGLKEKYLVRTKLEIFNKKMKSAYYGLDRDMERSFDVHAVSGCCFMVSSKCAKSIFPMDENTFLFEEELIIGVLMESHGFKTRYFSNAIVTHAHGQSTKQNSGFAYICLVESEIYYCKRYLHTPLIKILPLYLLRTIHWIYDALLYKSFRKNFIKYFKVTAVALLKHY
jgi:GT2 family glycosyltransferase